MPAVIIKDVFRSGSVSESESKYSDIKVRKISPRRLVEMT
jgi:hypothetical protein